MESTVLQMIPYENMQQIYTSLGLMEVKMITDPVILLCIAHYCVLQINLSSQILYHLTRMMICATFPLKHAVVVLWCACHIEQKIINKKSVHFQKFLVFDSLQTYANFGHF